MTRPIHQVTLLAAGGLSVEKRNWKHVFQLFPKETLAKHVSLMLFPWETGLGASSVKEPTGSFVLYLSPIYLCVKGFPK
jgi:hypothetical protein